MTLYVGLGSAVNCVEHHKAVLGSTILGGQKNFKSEIFGKEKGLPTSF